MDSKSSYSIVSENPMYWRSASAALKAGCLHVWHELPLWKQAWIIAAVETDIDIINMARS